MAGHVREKQERIVEAVRRGLEGDDAVEFIRQSGYAMSSAGIARHLRTMGGRGAVLELIEAGKANAEVLQACFPDVDADELPHEPPSQTELFTGERPSRGIAPLELQDTPLHETRKMTITVPAELYEAICLAAKGEGMSKSQLVIDILSSALADMPRREEEAS